MKKRKYEVMNMFIILGLIGLIVALAVALVPLYLFGFDVTSFSMFFILPIGAMIVGAIAGAFYLKGLKKSNVKATGTTFLIAVFISLVLFGGIQFGSYYMTYINEDGNLNYQFEGYHVSEFFGVGEISFSNFIEYKKFEIANQTITFRRRARTAEIDSNAVVNWIFFIIDYIGLFLGVVIMYVFVATADYCDECGKYYKKEKKIRIQGGSKVPLNELIEMLKADKKEEVITFIKDNPISAKPTENAYKDITLSYCEDCMDGLLEVEHYYLNDKNKFDSSTGENIELSKGQAEWFMES